MISSAHVSSKTSSSFFGDGVYWFFFVGKRVSSFFGDGVLVFLLVNMFKLSDNLT